MEKTLFWWRVATIVAKVDHVVVYADAVEILCVHGAIQDAIYSAETVGMAFALKRKIYESLPVSVKRSVCLVSFSLLAGKAYRDTFRRGAWFDRASREELRQVQERELGEADKPKRYLTIVDGIVGGEGDGPVRPEPVASHLLVAGTNPACVDAVVGQLMGFDPQALPIVREAFAEHPLPIADCRLNETMVEDGREGRSAPIGELQGAVPGGFRPHFGWKSLAHGEED